MIPAAILVVIALILVLGANLYHLVAISRIHERLKKHDEALFALRQEMQSTKKLPGAFQ